MYFFILYHYTLHRCGVKTAPGCHFMRTMVQLRKSSKQVRKETAHKKRSSKDLVFKSCPSTGSCGGSKPPWQLGRTLGWVLRYSQELCALNSTNSPTLVTEPSGVSYSTATEKCTVMRQFAGNRTQWFSSLGCKKEKNISVKSLSALQPGRTATGTTRPTVRLRVRQGRQSSRRWPHPDHPQLSGSEPHFYRPRPCRNLGFLWPRKAAFYRKERKRLPKSISLWAKWPWLNPIIRNWIQYVIKKDF